MKGISFSEPMVRAWLSGNKSVTRRLMKPQPYFNDVDGGCWYSRWSRTEGFKHYVSQTHFRKGVAQDFSPYRSGETVYLKETWQYNPFGGIVYKAGSGIVDCGGRGWKSPRFMPERAARSHAWIVSVRPERVQEITTRECVREGMICGSVLDGNSEDVLRTVRESKSCLVAAALIKVSGVPPRKQFQILWNTLHPGSWERNDWVWRIELEKRLGG